MPYKGKIEKLEKAIKSLNSYNEQLKEHIVDQQVNIEGLSLDLHTERNRNDEFVEKDNKEIEALEEDLNNLKKKSTEEKEKLENDYKKKFRNLPSDQIKIRQK